MTHDELHPDGPSQLELAAYADGRLEPPRREAIEAHLAECGLCLDAVRDAVQARIDDTMPVSLPGPAVLTAAQQLVTGTGTSTIDVAESPWRPSWQIAGRWIATAVAALVIAVFGWRFGNETVPLPELQSDEAIAAAMSFGVFADPQAALSLDLGDPVRAEITR